MTEDEAVTFDQALTAAAFALAGEKNWRAVTPAAAASRAELDLSRARARFKNTFAILTRFGELTTQTILANAATEGSVRDRLFDMLMMRFDALQAHRAGILALMHHLPRDPALTFCLLTADKRSLRAILNAAGVTSRLQAELILRGLLLVWYAGLRAFTKDDSPDLPATMRAVDEALNRADQAVKWLPNCATMRAATPNR